MAFSRLHGVDVVIHQVNAPLWRVEGAVARVSAAKTELHVSYHNGDHYNSVRRNDERNAVAPAAVKITVSENPQATCLAHSSRAAFPSIAFC